MNAELLNYSINYGIQKERETPNKKRKESEWQIRKSLNLEKVHYNNSRGWNEDGC